MASLEATMSSKTKLVSLSSVHWCTGMPLPLAEVGRLCKSYGALFVVDGAQGVGHQPIDVKAMHIDAMAFSAWKWLMGPLGVGGLYLSESLMDRLSFPFKGTGSVINDRAYLPHRDDLKSGAERYVTSSPSVGDWVHWHASLSFLSEIGFDAVRRRCLFLARYLGERLADAGFELASRGFDAPSAIVAARKHGVDAEAMVEKLQAHGVVAAPRLGYVRLAPHILNTVSQLDKVAALMTS
jgi:selenocysteine lyase/cysteine desulfurase